MKRLLAASAVLVAMLVLAACGSSSSSRSSSSGSTTTAAAGGSDTAFAKVLDEAKGQTVRWWMYGGDPKINSYVNRFVKPAAAKLGVRLQVVPVSDTVDAVNRVVAERKAGKTSGGGVDLIWINGENFASGKPVGLWLKDWASSLPNAKYVDEASPLIAKDFQVAVDGQESPWSGAGFIYAYDQAKVPQPPKTFQELLTWAKAHPGRFAYPAPPDYTGSAFVRQVIQRLGSQAKGLAYLKELKPYTYKQGKIYPKSEQELDQLFADGQVDFTMSYDSNFVNLGVEKHQFPTTTRPFLIGGGALQNTSYVTIPANAAHVAGAKVVANLLLSPTLQARKQDPKILGIPTVLSLGRLPAATRKLFATASNPYVLASLGTPLNELPASDVAPIEKAWTSQVLR
ncbi:MAG: ABC transporter substrate-binding protein [Solirubrobacterales bacterium]